MHELILDMIFELNYIEKLKIIANRLIKPLTLIKHKYFMTIFRLVEKNRDVKLALLLLLLLIT